MVETPSSGFFRVGVSGRPGPLKRRMAPAGAARTILREPRRSRGRESTRFASRNRAGDSAATQVDSAAGRTHSEEEP